MLAKLLLIVPEAQYLNKLRVFDMHVALRLLARSLDTSRTCFKFSLQVVLPASKAKCVTTLEREAILLIYLLVADRAVATVHLRKRVSCFWELLSDLGVYY